MGFFKKILYAFGGGADVYTEQEEDALLLSDSPEAEAPVQPATQPVPQPMEHIPELHPDMVFESVVKLFNDAQPAFIRDALDPQRQRRLIYESLELSMQTYLDGLGSAVRKHCEQQWSAKDAEMNHQMEELRQQALKLEEQKADLKEKQLSADRQKRALTERVHDLETQLGRLEAEREQFEIENKSLINKIKVARLEGSDPELVKINADLQAEMDRLVTALEQAQDKNAIAQTMMDDFRQKASKAHEEAHMAAVELEKAQARMAQMEQVIEETRPLVELYAHSEEMLTMRDKRITSLQAQVDDLTQALDNARADLEKAHAELDDARKVTPVTDNISPAEPPVITDTALAELEQAFEAGSWHAGESVVTYRKNNKKPRRQRSDGSDGETDERQMSLF
ncbi:MAG: hypothetical protein K2M79_04865 [Muribaculaceae bacterium]|nr:hypothetical protein [Muribaculaceae bacterium]